jgi:membrane fusion protein (multidrug efflux system)
MFDFPRNLMQCGLLTGMLILGQTTTSFAQPPVTADPNQVTIKRESLLLTSPDHYKVPLILKPQRQIMFVATAGGLIENVQGKPGDQLREQAEIIRLDTTREALLLIKAKADYEAGKMREQLAKDGKGNVPAGVAAEELKSLKALLDLAQLDVDRRVLRAPFSGKIGAVHVAVGQYVRTGDLLASYGDQSQLTVNVPVDRIKAKEGDEIDLKIEGNPVKGKIQVINPLSLEFDNLRELIESPATATVIIDNAQAKLFPGQSVFVDIIPKEAVTRVPNQVIATNQTAGDRKIQVIRENTVRDIPIRLLAPVGNDYTYVTGPFKPGDEVILSSSIPLTDGVTVQSTMQPAPDANAPPKSATNF